MQNLKKTRTRLSPEVRIDHILNHAAEIVSSEGVAAVSMERISREAGVSKSLVYSYFPSTTALLKTLLLRELKALRKKQFEAAEQAKSFEQLVRSVTHEYLKYIEEKGLLIYRLQSEPSVAHGHSPADFSRDAAIQYVANIISKHFNLPKSIAIPAADISFGLPDAAGNYLDQNQADRQQIEDLTVAMIIGSITAIKENYEVKFKSLPSGS